MVDAPTSELRRRFLSRKLVTLVSIAPRLEVNLPGVTRRASADHTTILEVDTAAVRVEQVISAALALGGVEDVTIEDPPMEEVVHEIYSQTV